MTRRCADDAGATTVKFCVDCRSFGTKSLAHDKLAEFQGPALLVYNDSQFSDEDFDSIQSIGDSKKRGQLAKTGRFGIGFNSCYHLTELPTFLSRNFLVMFDPQAKFLPDINPANPGKRIDILSPTVHEHFGDQIAPFKAFGADLQRVFAGTLFRLPLRTHAQAGSSRLSSKVHSPADVQQLLQEFMAEAQHCLLFLKNVASIEALVWEEAAAAPRSEWVCALANTGPELAAARARVPAQVAQAQKTALTEKKLAFKHTQSDYELRVRVTRGGAGVGPGEAGDGHDGVGQPWMEQRWMVSVACGDGASRAGRLACHPDNYHLKLVPWVGVAAAMGTVGACEGGVTGRAFCFLPLPAETGLPVHVNGYFELSSNRRDIWRGDDMAGEGRTRAEWNRALLEDVVAPTYARLLQRIAGTDGLAPAQLEWYYSIWAKCASSGGLQEPWSSLARQVYACLHHLPCLYVPPPLSAGVPSSGRQGTWVAPKEAMYVGMAGDAGATVRQALLEDGKPIVCVPDSVRESFAAADLALEEASPAWMRQHMAQSKVAAVWRTKGQARADTRLTLLEYCLADLDADADPRSPSGSKYAELCGLALVPAADGSSQTVARKGEGPAAALEGSLLVGDAAECGILYSLASTMVEPTLPDTVMLHMRSRAIAAYTNIHTLTAADVAACLSRVLPREWRGAAEVQWQPGKGGHPDADWLRRVWAYLEKDEARPGGPGRSGAALASFRDWPLLPTLEGTLCALGDIGPAAGQGTKV